jgi:CRISPR-associated protein (TIGR03984 family)
MTPDLCTKLELPIQGTDFDDAVLIQWINEQAKANQLSYLLAHAEDGVIWGHFIRDSLLTSGEAFDKLPVLRLRTLQQCRIFGARGEILIWRTEEGWGCRLCQEKDDAGIDFISENQMLWGTKKVKAEKDGFTLLVDGSQGLKHAVPLTSIPFSERAVRPTRLLVRHYITYDEDGLAYIFLSRLVDLTSKDQENSK